MTSAAVLLIDGFEEIEAITVIDVLRRADVAVDVIGVEAKRVTGSHNISIGADGLLAERAAQTYHAVVLPGGMPGAARLRDSEAVKRFVVRHAEAGRLVGAICAAPIALGAWGLLDGKAATCFPGFEAELGSATVSPGDVVNADNIVTSRGVGTALAFALALVERLVHVDTAVDLGKRMLVPRPQR
jgi:4-methyl-5(b-hydroxyethyl)-thiazole monophosphate biosynthesis